MSSIEVVILAAKRTPWGSFQGVLAPLTATQLGAGAAASAIDAAGITASQIDEVVLGCVLQAGLGQSPARQASVAAGVPVDVPTTTLNKICGSGLKAIMLVATQIHSGEISVALAGGFESMSNAPYLLPKARAGLRMGNAELLDYMIHDGLRNPFDGLNMGCFADRTASKYGFTPADQDAYASESARRARRAAGFRDPVAHFVALPG